MNVPAPLVKMVQRAMKTRQPTAFWAHQQTRCPKHILFVACQLKIIDTHGTFPIICSIVASWTRFIHPPVTKGR